MPFVQAWGLPLNPENVELMAYAALVAARSNKSYEEVHTEIRALIAEDARAHEAMRDAMDRDLRRQTDG